jgi:hypothetical protein
MATVTILKAIITQIKDVMIVDQDKHSGGHSEVFYDLANAVWYIESAIKRLKLENT